MGAGRTLADWLGYQQQLHPQAIDLGLERVRMVAERLGLLPLSGRTVIVGGTNGKGSTATLLASLARALGLRVGLFTSPHLQHYNERVCIDGREARDAGLVAAFERIEAARGACSLTYFEFNTLAALLLFRDAGVQLNVLEVGLGGRLDATNLADAEVAVLCSVGLDHRDWLGSTLEEIGAEKAGIFRPGQRVVLGGAAMPDSVMRRLAQLECRVQTAGADFDWRIHGDGSWDFLQPGGTLHGLPPPALAGAIQYRNAATALAALGALPGLPRLDVPAAAAALRAVRLSGRLQIVPGAVEWIFDVAHNEAAAAVLATELRARPARGRRYAVFGMLADKDAAAVAAQLDPLVDHWLLCTAEGARALDAALLRERMGAVRGTVERCDTVVDACERATTLAAPGDRVLVAGSFHTVGPALHWRGLY